MIAQQLRLFMFVVLNAGREDVGIDDIGIAEGFVDILGDGHVAELHAALDDPAFGAAVGRAGDRDVHIDLGAA